MRRRGTLCQRAGMPHRRIIVASPMLAIGLAVLVYLGAASTGRTAGGTGRMYSPSTIVAGMARRPAAWLGHIVPVRGEVAPGDEALFTTYGARALPCPSFPHSTAAL